jgi:hypothetical protein
MNELQCSRAGRVTRLSGNRHSKPLGKRDDANSELCRARVLTVLSQKSDMMCTDLMLLGKGPERNFLQRNQALRRLHYEPGSGS